MSLSRRSLVLMYGVQTSNAPPTSRRMRARRVCSDYSYSTRANRQVSLRDPPVSRRCQGRRPGPALHERRRWKLKRRSNESPCAFPAPGTLSRQRVAGSCGLARFGQRGALPSARCLVHWLLACGGAVSSLAADFAPALASDGARCHQDLEGRVGANGLHCGVGRVGGALGRG